MNTEIKRFKKTNKKSNQIQQYLQVWFSIQKNICTTPHLKNKKVKSEDLNRCRKVFDKAQHDKNFEQTRTRRELPQTNKR